MSGERQYVGYHDLGSLPIKARETVTIPAGTIVHQIGPNSRTYALKRRQTVLVNHLLPGRSVKPVDQRPKDRFNGHDAAYAEYDALVERMRAAQGDEYRTLYCAVCDFWVHVENPKIRWPGTGGYWCEVDINDVLPENAATEAA